MRYYGDVSYLEYKVEARFLWWDIGFWMLVPRPYYDYITGRESAQLTPTCLRNEAFYAGDQNGPAIAKRWPDIKDYFEQVYNPEQAELEREGKLRWENRHGRTGEVYDI